MKPLAALSRPLGLSAVIAATIVGCAPAGLPATQPTTPPASTGATAAPTAAAAAAPVPTVRIVEPAAGAGRAPVRIQVGGTVAEGPMYLATERGYFAEQGISPQFVTFDGAAQAIPALSTGQIDVGAGSLSASMINAIDRGIDIRVVAPQSENRGCDHSSTWILVRKDLADSGAIRSPADLRGRKIALSGVAGSSEYLADALLRQGGLQPSDVDYVQMAFPDMGAALGGRTIDVAFNAEPNATSFVDRGLAARWLCAADVIPNLQYTFLLYAPQFANQHADLAQRWMVAYLRGARDWQTMLETGQDKDPDLTILGKYTPVKDLALLERISVPVPAAEARIDTTNIAKQIAWMRQRGYIAQEPPIERVVDTRFVDGATQAAGR